MDPNANLAEQVELARKIAREDLRLNDLETHALRLAELVEALNEWIIKGGFLPDAWHLPVRGLKETH